MNFLYTLEQYKKISKTLIVVATGFEPVTFRV